MRFRGLGSAGLLSPDLAPASFPAMIDALRVTAEPDRRLGAQ